MNTEIKNIIKSASQIAWYLWSKGWAERNAGNISINISHLVNDDIGKNNEFTENRLDKEYPKLNGMYFFVTATGKRMRDIAKHPFENSCIIKIIEKGKKYRVINISKKIKEIQPTSELSTHLAIHEIVKKDKRKCKVIIHTHSSELIALTQISELKDEEKLNHLLWGMHPETIIFIPKGVGFVPYQTPGTLEIAESTLKSFRNMICYCGKSMVYLLWERILTILLI